MNSKARYSIVSGIGENIEAINPLSTDGVNFEEAISATEFGKFNLILILVAIPVGCSFVFEVTVMSYVFPAAQCDLNLTLEDKGLLNSITYAGMISTAFVWGYLCDTFGRKKLLYVGFFLDALFIAISALSQTFAVLMISKFLGGIVINGPFAAFTCYLSEFHCTQHRARIQMIFGIIFSAATIFLPLIAGVILPADIDFTLLGNLRIHPWNIYLFVSALCPFLGGCAFIFLPESPKFLMSIGQTDQALKVLQLIYRLNTGKPGDTYPIKNLIDERKVNQSDSSKPLVQNTPRSSKQAFSEGFTQLKPLFFRPLLPKLILVCGLQLLFMMSLNTLRLWLPQLFQAINDYEFYNNGTSAHLCTMLENIRGKNVSTSPECVVNTNNSQVYINAMIVATCTLFGHAIAGSLINILGKKALLVVQGTTAGICGVCLYFATSTNMTLVFSSIYIAVGTTSINILVSAVVELFPTTLRTMTVSVTMMMGRIGAMTGNLVFPFLLKSGCAPPFFTIGGVMICCAFLSLFLPNTDLKAMQ